jgi:hypothetical protein
MANYRFNGVDLVQYGDSLLTDLSQNLTIQWTEGNVYFVDYDIQEGDTPENIAYRLWGDSSLSWIICYINNIVDPFFDWPLRSDELMEYVKNKYGENRVYSVHHYIKGKYVVNYVQGDQQIEPVTNYAYEFANNQ